MRSIRLLMSRWYCRPWICCSIIFLTSCDVFDASPLTESQRKEICVSSYMERFYISIVEGPTLDDFFSVLKDNQTYFSRVTAGSFDASAILYLLPIIPSSQQISRISDKDFEQLSVFYNQRDDYEVPLSDELASSETYRVFQELSEEVALKLDVSKRLVNQKLCKWSYVVGEDQLREDKHAIIDLKDVCEIEAPTSAKFIVPDEKAFYEEEFRDQLTQMMESISLRTAPLWRSNWNSSESGACLLYAFSKRDE